tara:strand:- start:315 stop:824 length:510 start_codon:yes stop_codon:yes gene_type:complete
MLIICPNCSKSFEINSELIPLNGRLVQCGSCDHKWHFIKDKENETDTEKNELKINDVENISVLNENEDLNFKNNITKKEEPKEIIINNKNDSVENSNDYKAIEKKEVKKNSVNYFKYFIILIISFIALIILIDTFKVNISRFFPQIDFLLNNLYETLKDLKLFFIDLIN